MSSLLSKIVGDDPSPRLYSGATIQVQRSQRTDEIERMMNEMQQRRYMVRVGRPTQGQLPQPSEDQVIREDIANVMKVSDVLPKLFKVAVGGCVS